MSSVLLESRPYRPFKSSEEYLYAMKEDLAEWLQTMYPHLNINCENFMEKLETGVPLCEHANAVKLQAIEYVEKKQAKRLMSKSIMGILDEAIRTVNIQDVKYFNTAKAGTFFARDNVSNFIDWCRHSLQIIECLLFESDDLILRKNEKHFILCLLEVARRGAKFGMLAPMLIQMERQIDREIALDNKKLGVADSNENQNGLLDDDDEDSDLENEKTPLIYGPVPQIITNDLKSLDEMVRDLVAQCNCPTQFPMVRVSEGKYRIGDTKVLIFVRILRNHVMVRVGGGWDTLAHYLDKHDPCRCRSQHRTTQGARLVNKPGAADLHGSHVYYDRSNQAPTQPTSLPYNPTTGNSLGPPMNALNRSRSRSPSHLGTDRRSIDRRSVSPSYKRLQPPANRSRSPTPNFTTTHTTRLSQRGHHNVGRVSSGPQSLPCIPVSPPRVKHVSQISIPVEIKTTIKTEATLQVNDTDTQSDTTSEVSDEGYRSLGVIQDKSSKPKVSECSQNSTDEVDESDHQQVYTDDDLNDMGLRKTAYSQIYEPSDPRYKKTQQNPITDTLEIPQHTQITATNITPVQKQGSKLQKPKERSFVKSASTERESPKLPPKYKKANSTLNGTWNGRTKSNRPSLCQETFSPPLTRNGMSRRSFSSDRRPSSATTSPTKGSLRKELMKAVTQKHDDAEILQQVQEVLKKYGSLSQLCMEDEQDLPKLSRTSERMSYKSPRKDSRPENISKIPAPVVR